MEMFIEEEADHKGSGCTAQQTCEAGTDAQQVSSPAATNKTPERG
jgi:hypothetical protein